MAVPVLGRLCPCKQLATPPPPIGWRARLTVERLGYPRNKVPLGAVSANDRRGFRRFTSDDTSKHSMTECQQRMVSTILRRLRRDKTAIIYNRNEAPLLSLLTGEEPRLLALNACCCHHRIPRLTRSHPSSHPTSPADLLPRSPSVHNRPDGANSSEPIGPDSGGWPTRWLAEYLPTGADLSKSRTHPTPHQDRTLGSRSYLVCFPEMGTSVGRQQGCSHEAGRPS